MDNAEIAWYQAQLNRDKETFLYAYSKGYIQGWEDCRKEWLTHTPERKQEVTK